MPVTTRNIAFLVGNPYFATVAEWGVDPKFIVHFQKKLCLFVGTRLRKAYPKVFLELQVAIL